MVRLHRLDAEKELCEVVEHSPGEGVVVLTPGILQIIVAFVVEHLIGGQVHRSIQKLRQCKHRGLKIIFSLFQTHCKSREKPAKATEDQGLNQPDDVEKSPALDRDAVAGEEDRDRAVDGHGHGEHEEPAPVAETHAVVDVGAVVVKLGNTSVADPNIVHHLSKIVATFLINRPAVLCSDGSDSFAGVAQAENIRTQFIIR